MQGACNIRLARLLFFSQVTCKTPSRPLSPVFHRLRCFHGILLANAAPNLFFTFFVDYLRCLSYSLHMFARNTAPLLVRRANREKNRKHTMNTTLEHTLPNGTRIVAHPRVEILHRANTQGPRIWQTQLVETFHACGRLERKLIQFWGHADGRQSHTNSIPA
jgi:hypothetical protein